MSDERDTETERVELDNERLRTLARSVSRLRD